MNIDYRLLRESPRLLVAECKDSDATEVLQHIARINEKELPYNLNLEDNRTKHTDEEVNEFMHIKLCNIVELC